MKTNYQMLSTLDAVFTPMQRGVISATEFDIVKRTLYISRMDELALRNLRDFAVMYYTTKVEKLQESKQYDDAFAMLDRMSAVTSVVDSQIVKLGGEV